MPIKTVKTPSTHLLRRLKLKRLYTKSWWGFGANETAGGMVKHLRKHFGSLLKTLYAYHTPSFPLLDIHPREMKAYVHTKVFTQMCIVSLLQLSKSGSITGE